jgi:hypothetical protein
MSQINSFTPAAQLTELLATDGKFTLDTAKALEAIRALELETPIALVESEDVFALISEMRGHEALVSPHPAWEARVDDRDEYIDVFVENWAGDTGMPGTPLLRFGTTSTEVRKLVSRDEGSMTEADWLAIAEHVVDKANAAVHAIRALTAPAA